MKPRGVFWLWPVAWWVCAPCFGDSYNLNPTAATGSARSVALGGTTAALPNDYAAVFINPAGLGGISDTGIDFGSDSNQIDNFIPDFNSPKGRILNDPINYSYNGARYVSEDGWGFGFATQTPYRIDNVFNGNLVRTKKGNFQFVNNADQTEIIADNNTYTLALGKSFLDKRMALGLALNYVQVKESYDFAPVLATTAPVHQETTNDTLSADIGLLARPWRWLYIGAVYKMGYEVPFDQTRNPPAPAFPTVRPFKNAKVPHRLTLGLAWIPHPMFRLYAQSTYTLRMRDGVIVGSGFTPTPSSTVGVGRHNIVDGHWGVEFIPINEPDLTVKLWAGGYYEDTDVEGGFTRYHRTAGFGLSPWVLSLNMAVDDTNLYNNFVVGLGVDLLQVASRVAKKYGWKLPV